MMTQLRVRIKYHDVLVFERTYLGDSAFYIPRENEAVVVKDILYRVTGVTSGYSLDGSQTVSVNVKPL